MKQTRENLNKFFESSRRLFEKSVAVAGTPSFKKYNMAQTRVIHIIKRIVGRE
jgi:hypothetical protein